MAIPKILDGTAGPASESGVPSYNAIWNGSQWVPMGSTNAMPVSQPGLTAVAPVCILIPAAVSTITANTKAAASVVTTAAAHGLTSGESVTIAGSNSTTTINGVRVVTVLSATTFSVPVDTSGGASAGTATFGSVAGQSAKLIEATAGRTTLLVMAAPQNTSYVHVGCANTITAT